MNLDLDNVEINDNTGEDKKENTGGLVGSADKNTENKNTAKVSADEVNVLERPYPSQVVTGTFPVEDVTYNTIIFEYATEYESHVIDIKFLSSERNNSYSFRVKMINMKSIEIQYGFNSDKYLDAIAENINKAWDLLESEGYNFPLMLTQVTTA